MRVSEEFALEFHQLHFLPVQFADDVRTSVLVYAAEFFGDVDRIDRDALGLASPARKRDQVVEETRADSLAQMRSPSTSSQPRSRAVRGARDVAIASRCAFELESNPSLRRSAFNMNSKGDARSRPHRRCRRCAACRAFEITARRVHFPAAATRHRAVVILPCAPAPMPR